MLFGFGKMKTVETMLAELADVGIACKPGVTNEQLFADFGRDEIEKDGFDALLCTMGSEQFDSETMETLEPLSDDVWHFDTEAIYDHGSYTEIVLKACRLTGGDLVFARCQDFVDVENKVAWVELSADGGTERIDFEVNDDWVDPKVFDCLKVRLTATGWKRQFAAHDLGGQDVLLICKSPVEIEAINRATGLRFDPLNV